MRGTRAVLQRVADGETLEQTFLPAPSAATYRLVPPRGRHDISRGPHSYQAISDRHGNKCTLQE